MTELERLVRQIRVHYPVTLSLNEENDLVEMLNRKYSVTLRNNDSSAGNTSDELIMQRNIMSRVRGLKQGSKRPDKLLLNDTGKFEIRDQSDIDELLNYLKFEVLPCGERNAKHYVDMMSVIKIIQYFNRSDLKRSNTSVEQLYSDEELMSKIEDMVVRLTNRCIKDEVFYRKIKETYAFIDFQQELKFLFQTHRNTISKPVKQQDDNLVDEVELSRQILDLLDNLTVNPKFEFGIPPSDNIENKVEATEEIVKLFKTYQNSVLRPVNNSDEQSIIK